ncbi:MAG: hypothetical protein KDB53_11105, partial [Planctomycetes bacterium]|nr:hypothetical protein [Planctomycetota bacterium]
MESRSSSWVTRLVAIFLLVLVVQQVVALAGLMSESQRISALQRRLEDPSGSSRSVLAGLLALDADDQLRSRSAETLPAARDRACRQALVNEAWLVLPGDRRVALQRALGRPIGLATHATELGLRLDEGSELSSLVIGLRQGSHQASLAGHASFLLPELPADGTPVPLNCGFELAKGRTTTDSCLALKLHRDDTPPSIEVFSAGDNKIETEQDRLTLRQGEGLRVAVVDDSMLTQLELKVGGALAPSNPDEPWITMPDPLRGREETRLEILAEDSAGHRSHRSLRLARWKRSPPELQEFSVDGHTCNRPDGTIRVRSNRFAISCRLRGVEPGDRVLFRIGPQVVVATTGEGDRWDSEIEVATTPLMNHRVVVLAGARDEEAEAGAFQVVVDTRPPRIELVDASGNNHLTGRIETIFPASFIVRIEDESVLRDSDIQVDTTGGIRAMSPVLNGTRFTRELQVSAPGEVFVEARDRLGNAGPTRKFVFAAPGPGEDGQGPRLRLFAGNQELPAEGEILIFWERADNLRLEVTDDGGVDPDAIALTGGRFTDEAAPTERSMMRQLEAVGPLVIEARDRAGHVTLRSFQVTIVNEAPSVIEFG